MEKIAVITDSCSDIPAELARASQIFVLPMIIRAGEKEYRAGLDITSEDVYEILKTEMPKTSLPSLDDTLALLHALADSGYTHAIAVMLSGGLSGTANMLRVLGQQVPGLELYVWDSLRGSIGCGIVALEAAAAVREGLSFEEIKLRLPALQEHTHVFFSVDTLEYLHKGGRIGKITAIAGTALQIKPILSFQPDGQLSSVTKVRGRRLVQSKLCERVGQYVRPGCRYNLMVGDGGAPEEGARLRDRLTELFPDYEQLLYIKIDPTLSCYIGPGVLGAGIQILE